MLFNSLSFVLFFVVVYTLYRLASHRSQNVLLLVASYFFYGSWDWRFLSLILISTTVDFLCGRGIYQLQGKTQRKILLSVSLVTNLTLLGVFKYFDFFADSLRQLLAYGGLTISEFSLGIMLPVGISFYTFQTLSYTIDIYRKRLAPEPDFLNFALFVAFFPQLVAGPIERAANLLPQIRAPRDLSRDDLNIGAWLIFWGFFLKVFVADNLAPIADAAFSEMLLVDGKTALLGVYAFAFQIFGDFAGYSAIAIGVARLLGFRLMTNFLFPYLVTNPREFWRNWHISLSSWLRDYLYIPLGGNRGSTTKIYSNLLLTMLLGGLWHGAAWTFVLWGMFQGMMLIAYRVLSPALERVPGNHSGGLAWLLRVVLMFHMTCIGWLLFRATSVQQAWAMLVAIATDQSWLTESQIVTALELLFFTWLTIAIQASQYLTGGRTDLGHLPPLLRGAVIIVMAYSLIFWGRIGGPQFIYFQF